MADAHGVHAAFGEESLDVILGVPEERLRCPLEVLSIDVRAVRSVTVFLSGPVKKCLMLLDPSRSVDPVPIGRFRAPRQVTESARARSYFLS